MKKFLISYIEDNNLGVYPKEILISSENFISACKETLQKYPTVYAIKQMFGEIEEQWENYYSHESQDHLRRGQLEMEKSLNKILEK